jgi:hypothetical protein
LKTRISPSAFPTTDQPRLPPERRPGRATDPATGERLSLLAMATVGEGGWEGLGKPIYRPGRVQRLLPLQIK